MSWREVRCPLSAEPHLARWHAGEEVLSCAICDGGRHFEAAEVEELLGEAYLAFVEARPRLVPVDFEALAQLRKLLARTAAGALSLRESAELVLAYAADRWPALPRVAVEAALVGEARRMAA